MCVKKVQVTHPPRLCQMPKKASEWFLHVWFTTEAWRYETALLVTPFVTDSKPKAGLDHHLLFQQANNPKNTSRLCKSYLSKMKSNGLPPQSTTPNHDGLGWPLSFLLHVSMCTFIALMYLVWIYYEDNNKKTKNIQWMSQVQNFVPSNRTYF